MKKEESRIVEVLKRDYLFTDIFLTFMKIIVIGWIFTNVFLFGFSFAIKENEILTVVIAINITMLLCFAVCFYCHRIANRVYFDRKQKVNNLQELVNNKSEIPDDLKLLHQKYKDLLEIRSEENKNNVGE